MASAFRYTSSLRVAPIETTLAHARVVAAQVGITRVTDVTRLDRIGMPVFASIRPNAVVNSLCVSCGKGLHVDEARIGAYMEAIELAFAEPRRTIAKLRSALPGELLDGKTDGVFDFCPHPSARIDPLRPIDCVEAENVVTRARTLVPAEVVLFPVTETLAGGLLYFGADGNGLVSGNTPDEATLHGVLEVIERDVTSFHNARDTSQLVYHSALPALATGRSHTGQSLRDTLPDEIGRLIAHLDRLGFDLFIRYLPSALAMPTFQAVVRERNVLDGLHFGYGTHLSSGIALVRAVTEAVQCRLTVIHGGRDDLWGYFQTRSKMSPVQKASYLERHSNKALDPGKGVINFDEISDFSEHARDVPTALAFVLDLMDRNGLPQPLRVQLSPPELPIAVLRVIVPRMEIYAHGIHRMGPRLKNYLAELDRSAPETDAGEMSR